MTSASRTRGCSRPAEPGVAEAGQHRRVRLAGSLCGQGARGVLCPHPSGALAGGASADSGHRDGGGDCARSHLHLNQRAVLQRQRGVSGDGGGLPLRREPLRQRRGETIHRTDFTVIPSAVVYRPAQTTAWPRTYGPQTAKVVGPSGESIWTDKYGRVKVKFHWDRLAKGDDTSSCWVRVSSAWAGGATAGANPARGR